jgi:uncharacterized protein YbgA (DUF1722 family)
MELNITLTDTEVQELAALAQQYRRGDFNLIDPGTAFKLTMLGSGLLAHYMLVERRQEADNFYSGVSND